MKHRLQKNTNTLLLLTMWSTCLTSIESAAHTVAAHIFTFVCSAQTFIILQNIHGHGSFAARRNHWSLRVFLSLFWILICFISASFLPFLVVSLLFLSLPISAMY